MYSKNLRVVFYNMINDSQTITHNSFYDILLCHDKISINVGFWIILIVIPGSNPAETTTGIRQNGQLSSKNTCF